MKHEPVSKRRPINLTLDSDTVAAARELGINISATCNQALAAEVKKETDRRWQEENRPKMEAWSAWLEEHGLPYADQRLF